MTDDDPTTGVVVVAAETDLTADAVVTRLGVHTAVVRLDPGRLRNRVHLTGRYTKGRWTTVLRSGPHAVTLDERCSVYWRKPTPHHSRATPDERWHADENTTALLGLLRAQPLRLWCNDPTTMASARLRPAQLAAATRVGLTVPDTLITTDATAARAFVAEHHDRVVLKALTQRHTPMVPTTRIRLVDDLTAVDGCAHHLQALVDKRADARVTVVDNRAFTALITTRDGDLDWRVIPHEDTRYQAVEAPPEIERACLAHVRDLGLTCAAIDFAVDHAGRWWYLESNPGGQFGFVEYGAGLPIADAVAHVLLHGPAPRPKETP
ncbi:hypothetical protein [Embleya scabrispora]|uniref:hypothetical protein n=1 Tax=Embleya scabrispora TaxID=159449 RepID=UPI00037020DB|nr:hypothetical protein [Embleya scabrispora]MYS78660.1 hypothetical protein [Streptomyces sp. SID5474]